MPGSLDFLFNPKSIAVVGASNNPESHGHNHLNFQLCYGFKGEIYPINPKQMEVLGLKAYPSLEDVPGTIDHVICAIGINNVPDLLTQASHKGVKSMHIYSGRASETGRPEAKKLDEEILKRARQYGIRVVGPNALGLLCPKSGLAFGYDFPKEPGNVGAIMQSGANSTDLCHFAALRGVKFSKLASYGNALDINEMDLWAYFAEDPETKVLLCYNEGLRGNPQKFLELVRKAASLKPVIICKGGRSKAGARFTIGHTNSRADIAAEIWGEPIRQAGAIMVRDIDELLDMAVAFSQLPPIKGKRIGTGGGGGGNCVLYADTWEENGFVLPPLPQGMHEEFKKRGSQLWDWIKNPADFSIVAPDDPFTVPAALAEMAQYPDFDFIVGYVGEDIPFKIETLRKTLLGDVEGYIKVFKEGKKPFFAIIRSRPIGLREMDGQRHRVYATVRTRLLEEGVPFFESAESAARALNGLITYYQRKDKETA